MWCDGRRTATIPNMLIYFPVTVLCCIMLCPMLWWGFGWWWGDNQWWSYVTQCLGFCCCSTSSSSTLGRMESLFVGSLLYYSTTLSDDIISYSKQAHVGKQLAISANQSNPWLWAQFIWERMFLSLSLSISIATVHLKPLLVRDTINFICRKSVVSLRSRKIKVVL